MSAAISINIVDRLEEVESRASDAFRLAEMTSVAVNKLTEQVMELRDDVRVLLDCQNARLAVEKANKESNEIFLRRISVGSPILIVLTTFFLWAMKQYFK